MCPVHSGTSMASVLSPKPLAAALAAAASFVLSVPAELHRTAAVALWFVAVDTATGLASARLGHRMSSAQFREKLRSKLLCFGQILALCAGVAVLSSSWDWLVAGFWAVCASEALSILENLRASLPQAGSARSLAPLAVLLERLLGAFTHEETQNGSGNDSSAGTKGGES